MTKEQFIAGCVMCRICDKATAKTYADSKDELTEADFDEMRKKMKVRYNDTN